MFRQCMSDRSLAEQRAVLYDTARRIYRLPQ